MKRWTRFFVVMTILITAFIFSNSLRAAAESGAQSGRVMALLLQVFPFLDTLFGENLHHFVRKLAHFTEFAALGFFTVGISLSSRLTGKRLGLTLLYLALVPTLDETIQIFVPGRGPAVKDALLDFSGAVTGLLVMFVLWNLLKRVRKKT